VGETGGSDKREMTVARNAGECVDSVKVDASLMKLRDVTKNLTHREN
jgi:hypothetical protein